jgi:hypothetical protein
MIKSNLNSLVVRDLHALFSTSAPLGPSMVLALVFRSSMPLLALFLVHLPLVQHSYVSDHVSSCLL